MTDPRVLIVGAGPTGLVLALWLTRLGVPVRIIDKAARAGTTSRALVVHARTLEFYRQVGLADAVVEAGVRIANLRLSVKGKQAARMPFPRLGAGLTPYDFPLIFPQDAHELLLVERLEALGVTVERRTELLRLAERGAGVQATIRRPDGSEETCEAAYLAGCDGARSTVREQLAVGFPGGTYSGLFYVADVETAGSTGDDELHAGLEDADFVLVFPLQGKGRRRLVGVVRDLPPGRDHDSLTFADVPGKAIEHLRLHVEKVNWFSTYRVHHRVAHHFRAGRAFLLGDAAHVHSPVGGQGMNTGIGDAVNLAWKLAAVLRDGATGRLLDTYEPERIAFARRLVATTDRGFTLVTRRGILARLVRLQLVPRILPWLFRVPAVRRFFFKTVSQTVIAYRESWLSEGRAGPLRGGDRLPWIKGDAAGQDNFAPLTALAWQVHVYGEPRPGVAEACAERGLPLHVLTWQPEAMRRAGLRRDALYLIRPDGHLALVDRRADPERLRRYFAARAGLGRDLRPSKEGESERS